MRPVLSSLLLFLVGLSCRENPAPLPCGEEARQKVLLAHDSIANILSQDTQDLAGEETVTAWLDEAIVLSGNCQDFATDTLLAKACDKFGAYYRKWDKTADAKKRFQQALQFYKRAHKETPPQIDILRMYHLIGLTLQNEGEYLQALTYFDSAHLLTEASNPSPFVPNLIAVGLTYLEMNELSMAEKYLINARQRINANSPKKIYIRLPSLLANLSDCYRRQARLPDALRAGQEGVMLIKTNDWVVEKRSNLATCLLNLGNVWQDSLLKLGTEPSPQKIEARDSAIWYTKQALDNYQALDPPDVVNIGIALRNLGELYRRASLYNQAVEVLTNTLGDSAFQPHPNLLAEMYINRGEAWLDQSVFDQALTDFEQALRHLVPSWQPYGKHSLPPLDLPILNRSDLLLTLSDLALAHIGRAKQQPESLKIAVAAYDSLQQLANCIRGDYLSSDAKIRLAGESQAYLRKAFDVSLTLYELMNKDGQYLERAFRVAEQSKAFALLEAVRLNHLSRGLPEDLQLEEEKLQRRQARLEGDSFQAGNDAERAAQLQEQWFDNFEAFRRFKEKLKVEQPTYYKLRYAGANLTVADIQTKLLENDQGLLEYFFQDTLLHIFLITKDTFALKTQRIGQGFTAKVDKLCAQISNPQPSPQDETELCQTSHECWKILLQPFQNQLPDRLIVVPDYPFQLLPFEALLSKRVEGDVSEQVQKKNFLLFQRQISYCFSANLLWEMTQNATKRPLEKAVAVFAPHFPENLRLPGSLPGQLQEEELVLLKPIPNDLETEAINKQVHSKSFFNKAANKAAFLKACGRYAAVHASTHGILNHRDPNFNFIAFSQTDTLDTEELLKLSDLYAEKIHSELIVFSACETAAGQRMEGEGVISMARGLAYAGAKSVVSALFPVRSDNNAAIFSEFYNKLAAKDSALGKDVALAIAKRDFVLRSPDNHHPANWSGIVLIGATTPMELQKAKGSALIWYAFLGCVMVLALLAAWLRSKWSA